MTGPAASYLPVLVVADEPADAEAMSAVLARVPGWVDPGMRLPERMSRLLWGHEAGLGEAGVSSLVDRAELSAALRELADRLVSVAVPSGVSRVVEVVDKAVYLGRYLRDVWPDALVIAVGRDQPSPGVAAAQPDLAVTIDEMAAEPAAVARRVEELASQRAVGSAPPRRLRAAEGRVLPGRFRPTGSPLHGKVVVVLGAARSGTTWVHRLLTSNPAIAGTPTGETWLFSDVSPLWSESVRARVGDAATLSAMRAFCDRLLLAMRDREAPRASHVCEKTPATVWQLPVLSRLYPDAHYVHVIRDGRDVALSLMLTRGDSGDLGVAAREWVDAVGAVRSSQRSLSRLTEIRYEDLLADPRAVIEKVWQDIGVPVSARAHEALAERVGERVTPLPARGEIGTGKWRSLPDADRDLVEAVTTDTLRELGYPVGTP